MFSKVVFTSLVFVVLNCLAPSAFSATNSVKIGINVVIKAPERCDFSYSLNNTNTNKRISANCGDTSKSLEQFEKSAEFVTSTSSADNTKENFLRIVKTAQ